MAVGSWPWLLRLQRLRTSARDAPRPVVLGDAAYLPFPSSSFGGVTAVYMLCHLFEPIRAVREAHRVVRSGGLFVAVAPSRRDSPELDGLLPPSPPDTFDAEVGPALIAEVFGSVRGGRLGRTRSSSGGGYPIRPHCVAT